MILKDIISFLESRANLSLQESYDNSGLITGNASMEITGAIISLDCTEEVVMEAQRKGCNLVIAHHPIVFSGLKKINGKNYVERTIIAAIKHDIAIYAIHTNLDNVSQGVNRKIAEVLGLQDLKILEPMTGKLQKISVFVPESYLEKVRLAMFEVGAGEIGQYDHCSWSVSGTGTFRAGEGAQPFTGSIGSDHHEPEHRLELVFPTWKKSEVVAAMKSVHPYEEIAYDIYSIENQWTEIGAGMIGELPEALNTLDFLQLVKTTMKAGVVRFTKPTKEKVKRIAICGGSGSFLLKQAIQSGADVFVTADFKYHQFFDAESRIVIADIGHYESEQYTMQLLNDWLKQKFPTFASHLTEVITNPVYYL